jgi:hypothetical protein
MVSIAIDSGRASFEVEGIDKLWSFRSRFDLPLDHIVGVEHDPSAVGRWWHGFKIVGTDLIGLFAAGTFVYHGEMVFWDVRHPEQTIIVSLDHERYKKLIVEVADPQREVERLQSAIRK